MPSSRHFTRIDTSELKTRIIKKLGHMKAERYLYHLTRLLSLKLRKSEFSKHCISIIGKENISLHNEFIRSIIKNASFSKTPPLKGSNLEGPLNVKIGNGYRSSSFESRNGEVFLPSPPSGRSSHFRNGKFKDRPSPLGPHGKTQSMVCDESIPPRSQGQQSATELVSLGSRPPIEVLSVEEGEEVEQVRRSPTIQSRSPVRAPLGIPVPTGFARKSICSVSLTRFHPEMCRNSYELPDSRSLKKRLERKLEIEGLGVSTDCVNLLNNGLDAYLKRLVKPCMELARSRHKNEHPMQEGFPRFNGYIERQSRYVSASLLDFQASLELNPQLLGEDWPTHLEKVRLRDSYEYAPKN